MLISYLAPRLFKARISKFSSSIFLSTRSERFVSSLKSDKNAGDRAFKKHHGWLWLCVVSGFVGVAWYSFKREDIFLLPFRKTILLITTEDVTNENSNWLRVTNDTSENIYIRIHYGKSYAFSSGWHDVLSNTVHKISPDQSISFDYQKAVSSFSCFLPHLFYSNSSECLNNAENMEQLANDPNIQHCSLSFADDIAIRSTRGPPSQVSFTEENHSTSSLQSVTLLERQWGNAKSSMVETLSARIAQLPFISSVKANLTDPDVHPEILLSASARQGHSLPDGEQQRVHLKKHEMLSAWKAVYPTVTVDDIPNVAIALSGGGYRAMFSSLGFLCGLQDIQLLQSIMYVSAISGSTWTLASWFSYEQDLHKLYAHLCKVASTDLFSTDIDVLSLAVERSLQDSRISLVDIYGLALGNRFLPGTPRKLSLQKDHLALPIPIYTAVHGRANKPFTWFEFTPWEVGSVDDRIFVPTYSFSRPFLNGHDVTVYPEVSLSVLMGMFGSAFCASTRRIWEEIQFQTHTMLPTGLITWLDEQITDSQPLPPASFHNFAFQFLDRVKNSLFDEPTLYLADAGLDNNLPFPPLLRKERDIDMIICMDASADVHKLLNLFNGEIYAKRNGISFPEIRYKQILKDGHVISVFKNDDLTIIYLPTVYNPKYSPSFDPIKNIAQNGYCRTTNIQYNSGEAEELIELTRFTVVDCEEIIRNEFKDRLLRRQKKRLDLKKQEKLEKRRKREKRYEISRRRRERASRETSLVIWSQGGL